MNYKLYNADNLEIMTTYPDESVDVICIDPPYLYLKNQKLERVFDEPMFFSECKRLLTKNGFIIMFGRGSSFYRWNTILDEMGFTFKEEIVWNKSHCTSPLMNLSRVHETIAIFTKGKGTINKVKVPYLEMKGHDIDSVIGDVKRMRSILKNPKSLEAVQSFLKNNNLFTNDEKVTSTTISGGIVKVQDRSAAVMSIMNDGLNEKSIIRTDRNDPRLERSTSAQIGFYDGDRAANAFQSLSFGLNEKSIIKQVRDHYSAIHPTQKPVRLLERLLKLVIPMKNKKIVIADWFGGSFSTGEAVINLQSEFSDIEFEFIGTEIDKEYFEGGKARMATHSKK